MKVVAIALEDGMFGHRQENIEIAIGSAAHAWPRLRRTGGWGAFLDAGRHIDVEDAVFLHFPAPRQALQGWRMILPVPRQALQLRSIVKKPWVARTLP